ncbi:hypothetical protein A2U01_0023105 [Trifolium medium]|uniref:Uncharacterized protein n=1 Tax=Trifolium medium TaxID=97028 RepID=A0A392NQK4_9FABA|nr:hypothetical protein [Trifolium medium]
MGSGEKTTYDYGHEIIRSNPYSTLKIQVQPTEQDVEGIENGYVIRPVLPSLKRFYMCLEGCKQSFLRCRPFIGLDGCFLKGYYGGMILAADGTASKSVKPPKPISSDNQAPFTSALFKEVGTSSIGTRSKMQIRKPTS